MQGKQEYLKLVKANDCRKNKVTRCYRTKPIIETKENQTEKSQSQKEKTKTSKRENEQEMTKLERKQKYKELKRTLTQEWSIEMEFDDKGSEVLSTPSHFKCYIID